MVQAMINVNEDANRVLNIVKARFGLKTKSEAINLIAYEYEKTFLEPQVKPSYLKKLKKISKGKYLSQEEFERAVGSV